MSNTTTSRRRRALDRPSAPHPLAELAALVASARPFGRPCTEDAYVYALVDPRNGLPFYIGKGRGLRALVHGSPADLYNGAKHERIDAIRAADMRHEVVVIEHGLTDADAYELEAQLVARFDLWLTNIAPGGLGPDTETGWAERQLGRMKPFAEWALEQPRTPLECEIYFSTRDALRRLVEGDLFVKARHIIQITAPDGSTRVEIR